MTSVDLVTSGMHCASCSMLIQMSIEDLPGVASAKVDFGTGISHVEFDPDQLAVPQIVAAIKEAGYDARPKN